MQTILMCSLWRDPQCLYMQGEVAAREETFKVEEQAIAAVGALAADLRRSLDKVR